MAVVSAPASSRNVAGVALVIGSAVCFGTLGVFGKLAYRLGLSTPQLLSYRFALAAILLWLTAVVIREGLPPRRSLLGLIIMGGAGYVGQSGSYFSALHFIPASTNALLLYTFPVAVTLLAVVLFGEALSWIKLAACGLAFFGTLLVVEAQLHGAAPIGIVLGLGSAAFYSGYILFGSRQLAVAWTLPRIALIGSFVVLGTTIPVLTFILGLRMVGPSRAAILSTFEPACTVLLAVIILGELAGPLQYLGGALIIASVLLLEGSGWLASRVLAQAA